MKHYPLFMLRGGSVVEQATTRHFETTQHCLLIIVLLHDYKSICRVKARQESIGSHDKSSNRQSEKSTECCDLGGSRRGVVLYTTEYNLRT